MIALNFYGQESFPPHFIYPFHAAFWTLQATCVTVFNVRAIKSPFRASFSGLGVNRSQDHNYCTMTLDTTAISH